MKQRVQSGNSDWRTTGIRDGLQIALEWLEDLWVGKHDKLLRSVVVSQPEASYKQRITDTRLTKSLHQVLSPLAHCGT